ncbi:MAG TPA: MFS transporter [Bryobacteraceae bacterium]|nr:MFS transporter [Bryobacteraceae bacterium]
MTRNVAGMTLTSFFADVGYEMVGAVLPGFLAAIGVSPAALGWIEGTADAASSFLKLGSGWYGDRIGRRKPIVALGYFLSGTMLAIFAAATSWPLILAGRVAAWFGKGIRGPLRDAMLAESTPPEARGRVFGMHRAGDTAGAVAGPLLGVYLLSHLPRPDAASPFRTIFLISLVPGLLSFASMVFLVKEKAAPANRARKFWAALRELPRPYFRFLTGVALFGAGDFAPTLLVMAAAQLLAPQYGIVRAGEIGALFYVLRNAVQAAVSYPAGALGDRMNKVALLAVGYALGGCTALWAAALFAYGERSLAAIGGMFALAGIYAGIQDALEGAVPSDMVTQRERGTAYGMMGAVNGVGDLFASAMVGTIWTLISPSAAFLAAGALMIAGAIVVYLRTKAEPSQIAS